MSSRPKDEAIAADGSISQGREVQPMRCKPLRAVALASVVLAWGAMASPAAAKTYTYIFGTPSGGDYCDGLTLTNTGKNIYSGFHLNYDCDNNKSVAGGFAVKNRSLGSVIELVAAAPPDEPDVAQAFYLDMKHKIYYLYQIGGGFNVYTEIGSGMLIKGAPPVNTKGGVSSQHPRAGAKIEPMPSF